MNKVRNPLFPRLALIILLFLGMVSVEVMNPATAEAIWLGKNGYIYGGSGDACDSWANFYGTWIQRMVPGYNSSGDTFNYTCYIRNPINAGNDINVPTYPQCQSWETINGQVKRGCTKPTPEKEKGDCSDCPKQGARKTKHPITISNGNKFLKVTDFETVGPSPLRWTRYYNSMARKESSMGIGWRHNYSGRLWLSSSTVTIAYRPDGSAAVFTLTGGTWTTDPDIPQQLVKQGSQWLLTTTNDSVETYDSTGKLLSIVSRDGYQQTLNYNASNQLESVTDSYGRQVTFTYNSLRLETMTDPDGGVYTYAYDKTISHLVEPNLLVKVSYPDDTPGITTDNPTVTYLYEDEEYPYAVTGILDEHNVRFLTYGYDTDGRATFSELANGAERTDLVYHVDDRTTVTNALGQSIIYHFDWIHGSRKVTQEERLATATVPAANAYWTYDINGYLASTTDWNGNITTFIHNSRGLQTSRTEASATSEARTITTTWHATFRIPTQIQEPEKTTDFTYDTNGFLLTRTETDTTGGTTNGQTRTWTYTYTTSGQLQTVNGPRTVVTDLTTNTYTTEGFLKTVTNALGHVTDITSHSSRGLPLIVKDANNVETHLTYHPRGWLTSTTVKSNQGDVVTSFAYDDVGQLTQITRPDSSILNYEYDNAHRVTAVTNNLGERIDYTLDAAGNRTAETVKSSASTITRSQSRTFDTLSRLLTQVGAGTQTTTTAYDANGNAITLTDPLQHTTTQAFDALNRLIKVTDEKSGEAEYTYDGQDNLTTVDDQRDLTTTYVYNGFGDVIQMTSPDTGTTTYQTDSAGNRTQQTDARGVVTNYTYDALNRVATMQFPGNTTENVTYTYDSITGGNIGKGRLTSLTDQSGTTTFVYDDRGNVVTETRIINTQTYTTTYAYNLADNLLQVTYPSGRVVTYQRDTLGRVVAVTTQISSFGAPVLLANNITYHPFGPITSLTYGNGLGLTLTYDQDYRLTDIRTADGATVIQDLDYGYDNADNITTITDVLNTARNQTLGYDELHRLTSATGLYGTLGYTYDAVGNRLTRTAGVNTDTYTYATTSNQLLSILSGSNTRPFTFTTNGQISGDNRGTGENYGLSYNHQNRLNQITKNSTPTTYYLHNALGQRVVKDDLNSTTDAHYHYDRDGRLLAESDIQGVMTKEYIHLDGLPLAVIDTGSTGSGPILDLILDNSDTDVTTNGTWTTATEGTGYEGTDYLEHSQSGVPPGGELIDNDSAGFSTVGTWPTATGGTGYEGSNYLVRDPNAIPADIIVDNADATFSTTGSWTASTNIPGYYASNYLWHHPYQFSPDSITLDNGGTGFASTGNWTLSTNIAGYQGTNYQWYPAIGIGGNQQLLDNGGPEFSATGQWTLSTGVPGYQGANYQWHPLAGVVLPPSSIIIDNTDAQTSFVGNWYPATNVTGYWGINYGWHDGAQLGSSFTWTPTIPATTQYKVYARWQAWSSRATNATYTIHHAGGSTNVVQNHKINGSQWNLLGTFTMSPSSNHRLVLSGEGNGSLTSDAVAFVDVDAIPHLATWMPTITTAQEYEVYATWQAYAGRATDATYMIHHAGGTSHVVVDQTVNGNQWQLLGNFTMSQGNNHRVVLSESITGTIIADGVKFVPLNGARNTATWSPTIVLADDYDLFATWQADFDRATDATYTIHHANGSSNVVTNHQLNGSQFNLLGTYSFLPSSNHRIELTDAANGTVIADALKLVPATMNRVATWTPTIGTTDDYDVYAKWMAAPLHATNATYTVHHAGGSSPVVINQQQNGGQWTLLGTFNMSSSSGHRIELAGLGNGVVTADAVYVVPNGTTPNRVTWTPTLTASNTVDIFAKWMAETDRSDAVTYTVYHDGGSTDVTVNQQLNGAIWHYLGEFAMTPASNHRVEVTDSNKGTVAADAVRFVSVTGSSAGLMYVHSDHLGTPQKMTDGSQALVWDAVYQPFGEVHSMTGTTTNNQRFPGQYADAESGYSYNYFRDYDPTTGRYVESDPIGLNAGMNTYFYVGGEPVSYIDPFGLKSFSCRSSLDMLGGSGTRSGPDLPGNPLYHQYSCIVDRSGNVQCGGQTYDPNSPLGDRGLGGLGSPGAPSDDEFNPNQCELSQPDNDCFENCLRDEWKKPRPWYGIPFGTDCQEYDDDVNKRCRKKCNIR